MTDVKHVNIRSNEGRRYVFVVLAEILQVVLLA